MVPATGSGRSAARPPPEDELIGRTVGRFRIVRSIGNGGMATVYLAVQNVIGSKVAIKVLHPQMCAEPFLLEQFQSEAVAVNLVRHENIVNIFDLGQLPDRRPYLVMEYLDGSPLSALLRQGALPPEDAARVISQCCHAVHAAHRAGVVHRDLKPDNVFIVRHEENPTFVKVLDFGVAHLAAMGRPAHGTAVVGSPSYMAPEQWERPGEVDHRADVYALGVLAYCAFSGRKPFTGKSAEELERAHRELLPRPVHEVNPSLPPRLHEVLSRAMAKRPGDRFDSALELGALVEEAVSSAARPSRASSALPAAASTRTPAPGLRAWPRRHRVPALLAACAALLLVGYGGLQLSDGAAARRHLSTARQRIAEGRLTGPGGDTAVDHLLRARELAAGEPEVTTLVARLSDTFTDLAERAAARGDEGEASAHFTAALLLTPERQALQAALSGLEAKLRERARSQQARSCEPSALVTASSRR